MTTTDCIRELTVIPDATTAASSFILSFDVEEHHRIEAAAHLSCPAGLKQDYADRMERTTRELLEKLAKANTLATFFIVGEIAETHPQLVRDIAAAGHEVGSHSYDHTSIRNQNAASFAADLRRSVEALEHVTGIKVVGYRAPTFSIIRKTAWAVDVLAEHGLRYDSSIFPVRHDRYGIVDAPRTPFLACGREHEMLELPPVTYRVGSRNLPVAGGGYFRLFPLFMMRAGLSQLRRTTTPAVGMLYFHPWEFDTTQPKLPLNLISRFRTYVGISRSMGRLDELLNQYRFRRAIDVVAELEPIRTQLPKFAVSQ
jgi:polysaccharide deacetylase family protein (PEP-CTERM system associated)